MAIHLPIGSLKTHSGLEKSLCVYAHVENIGDGA